MLTTDLFIKSARHAGNVKRYHTVATLRTQDVAAHSFHLMRIYYQIFGSIPGRIARALVTHDLGEIGPGDIPHTAKLLWPAIGDVSKAAEADVIENMGFEQENAPHPDDRLRIRLCDMLEGWEFTLEEIMLGNGLIRWAHANYAEALAGAYRRLNPDDQTAVRNYMLKSVEFLGADDPEAYVSLTLKDRSELTQDAAE